jgi:hypothetical protein
VRLAALRPYSEGSERRPVALRPTLSGGLPFSGFGLLSLQRCLTDLSAYGVTTAKGCVRQRWRESVAGAMPGTRRMREKLGNPRWGDDCMDREGEEGRVFTPEAAGKNSSRPAIAA